MWNESWNLRHMWEAIERRYRVTFLVTFCLGLLVHLFMFMNLLPGNDETMFYFNLGGTRSFGRWGLYALQMDLPVVETSFIARYGMPWVKGLISIILLSIVACLVVNILELRHDILCVLCGAAIITFPSVAATFSYMFTSSSYFLGLCLSCIAVYLTKNCCDTKNWIKIVGGV